MIRHISFMWFFTVLFIVFLMFSNFFFRAYLDKHVNEAHVKLEACRPMREEVKKLEKILCQDLGLKSIVWDCGWNVAHYRGCLLAFQALAKHHPEVMNVLNNRALVFANDTGISLEGSVMLNSAEVRHNWLDVRCTIHFCLISYFNETPTSSICRRYLYFLADKERKEAWHCTTQTAGFRESSFAGPARYKSRPTVRKVTQLFEWP